MRHWLLAGCALLALASAASPVWSQPYTELRAATSEYRYVDVGYTFPNGAIVDSLYIGDPNLNELYLGAGFTWQPRAELSVIPIAYGVLGLDAGSDELGLILGAYVTFEKGPYKLLAYLGRFVNIRGDVPTYDFLDTGDLTRVIVGPWELGVSSTVYRTGSEWTHQTGPLVKRNDSKGFWGLGVRWGFSDEVRLIRAIYF